MQELAVPTRSPQGKCASGRACALVTDGRFSAGLPASDLAHLSSPPSGRCGALALVAEDYTIVIDILAPALRL